MSTAEDKKKEKLPVFQKRINEIRGEMSQEAFAKFIGVSRATIGFYENGERVPDAITLLKIAESCNVDVDYLLGRTNLPNGDATDRALAERYGFREHTIKAFDNFKIGYTDQERKKYIRNLMNDESLTEIPDERSYIDFFNFLFESGFEEIIKDLYIAYGNFLEDKQEETEYYENRNYSNEKLQIDREHFKDYSTTLTKLPKFEDVDWDEYDDDEKPEEDMETPPIRIGYFDVEGSLEFMLNMIKKDIERMIREMYEETLRKEETGNAKTK